MCKPLDSVFSWALVSTALPNRLDTEITKCPTSGSPRSPSLTTIRRSIIHRRRSLPSAAGRTFFVARQIPGSKNSPTFASVDLDIVKSAPSDQRGHVYERTSMLRYSAKFSAPRFVLAALIQPANSPGLTPVLAALLESDKTPPPGNCLLPLRSEEAAVPSPPVPEASGRDAQSGGPGARSRNHAVSHARLPSLDEL